MEYRQMTTQSYDSALELVKERLEQIDKIKNKFSGFPEVQEKLQNAKDALTDSYDLTKRIKDNKP